MLTRAGRQLPSGLRSPRVWQWLRYLVSLALLGLLLSRLEIGRTVAIIGDVKLGLLTLTLAFVIGDRLLAAYRWYVLLHGLNRGITYGGVLRLSLVSSFVGNFMPGGVDLVRIYGMTRRTADLPLALTSVLVERLQSMVALVALMLIGLAASPLELSAAITHAAWLGLALITAGFAALMYSRARHLVHRLLPGRSLAPVRAWLAKIYACLDAYRDRPFLIGWSMAVAFGFQLFRVVTVLVAGWSLGLEIPVVVLIALMPVVFFLTLLPISVAGGLGVRETGFVLLLALAGISAEASFALALLLSFGAIATAVPGAWLYARAGVVQAASGSPAAGVERAPGTSQ